MRYDGAVSDKGPSEDDAGTTSRPRIIDGPSYVIRVEDGHVHTRYFRRPDVGLDTGARFAGMCAAELARLARLPRDEARYCVVDLIAAPSISGPKTRALVAPFFAVWEQARRPVILVVGDQPIKQIQFYSLLADHAPTYGRVVETDDEAHAVARALLDEPAG